MIDVNASLGHWPFGPLPQSTPAALLRTMDKLGVEMACVASLEAAFAKDVQDTNRGLFRAVKRHRDRLLPFAVIDPTFPDADHDLAVCLDHHGAVGVRLLPAYHGYALDHPACQDMFGRLQEADVPVQILTVFDDPRMHHPQALVLPPDLTPLAALLAKLPRLRLAMLNVNLLGAEFYAPLRGLANVFFDIAWADGVDCVSCLIEGLGESRVLFGTNTPVSISLSAVYKLREANLRPPVQRMMTEDNARNFLGPQAFAD